jgi:hypothetical protein
LFSDIFTLLSPAQKFLMETKWLFATNVPKSQLGYLIYLCLLEVKMSCNLVLRWIYRKMFFNFNDILM